MYKSSITIEGSKNGSGGLLKRKFASLKGKISKKNKNVVKSSSETVYSALFLISSSLPAKYTIPTSPAINAHLKREIQLGIWKDGYQDSHQIIAGP